VSGHGISWGVCKSAPRLRQITMPAPHHSVFKGRVPFHTHTHTHTHPFNGPLSRTTRVSRYQKGKPNLDFTEARDSEWQWHQQGHMQVCISLQTDNHASTPPLSFLQARCPSCHPTNSIKALKAKTTSTVLWRKYVTPVVQTWLPVVSIFALHPRSV